MSDALLILADEKSGVSVDTLARTLSVPDVQVLQGIQAAIAYLSRGANPRYIVIDVGVRNKDVLPEIDQLAEVCSASVQVLSTGETNDVTFYRELIKRGVLEYLPYPVDFHALLEVVQATRSSPMRGEAAKKTEGKQGFVVGFCAASSGNGSSTVALNTALSLADIYQQPTVIVDLDYQFGMVARSLAIQSQYGIKEVFDNPDRGIDTSFINTMATPYSKFLRVIPAPQALKVVPDIKPDTIANLVQALRSEFQFVILDIPHIWTSWVQELLRHTNHNIIVSEVWLRSLTHVSRIISAWREAGISRERISLVMNRVGSKYRDATTLAEFQRVISLTAEFSIPNDTKLVAAAEHAGKTVVEFEASAITNEYKAIASKIYMLATGVMPTELVTKKKGLSALFGGH